MLAANLGLSMLIALAVACTGLSYAVNHLMMPVYRRYALARPNARSSHTVPTPQGAGLAVCGPVELREEIKKALLDAFEQYHKLLTHTG